MANASSATRPYNNQARTNGVARTNGARANGVSRPNGATRAPPPRAPSVQSNGDSQANGGTSAYAIMANRIANRVAEMAESITFVERPKQQAQGQVSEESAEKKRPRKLEMRLDTSPGSDVKFSAPFLDNTLQKMLALQNRMLRSSAELSKSEGVDEKVVREAAAQSAELSRIIALICAEKARQGA